MLCPKRRDADKKPQEPNKRELNMIRNDSVRLKEIRSRLSDISWWMRLLSQKIGKRANKDFKEVGGTVSKAIAESLCPLTIDELKDELGACCHAAGCRASDKGFLPISVSNYFQLLDWTARKLRSDKPSATPESAAPIFARLGIDAEVWCGLTRDFGKLFATVAGKPKVIESTRSRNRHQRYKIRNRAKELLTT